MKKMKTLLANLTLLMLLVEFSLKQAVDGFMKAIIIALPVIDTQT